MKVARNVGKILGALILTFTVFIGASIPIALITEKKVNNPGKAITKLVIRHVNIVPMDSNYVLNDYAVFIDQDKIVNICSDSLSDFNGYEVVDGGGKYLIPGLIDMHAHIFDRSDLTNYLSYGVTQVRNMMGFPMHLRWRRQWEGGEFPGSRIITASPTLNFGSDTDPFHKKLGENENPERIVEQYYSEGYDFIKIYDGITDQQFISILQRAKSLGIPVAGHAPVSVSRTKFLNSGIHSFEHIEEVYNNYLNRVKDDSLAHVVAGEFAVAKMPVCVTLSAYHNIYQASNNNDEFRQHLPVDEINPLLVVIGNKMLADYINSSDKRKEAISAKDAYLSKLTKLFHDEGVPLIFGTDTGPNLTVPGYTVHQELRLLKEAGLPNFNILKSATVDAAKLLGRKDSNGSINEGESAEFIVVKGNPLLDLRSLERPNVIIANRVYYDSIAIQSLAVIGKDKAGKYASLGNLLRQFFNK